MENSKYFYCNAKRTICCLDENPCYVYIKCNYLDKNELDKIDFRPIL